MSNLLEKASVILTPTAYNTSEVLCVKPSDGSGDFDFSRATDATRINSLGLVETIGINLPRINYEGGCGSWLFEPQSTNTVTYSEDYSQWNQLGAAPVLTTGQLSPSGELNATKISGTIGSTFLNLGASSSTTATRTIYAKSVSGTGTACLLSHNSNTNNLFTLTEDWQRFELTGSNATGGTAFYIDFRDNSQTLSEFIVWGAQSEELTYATSYIPTSGSTVTRNQDLCTNGGSLASINSTSGTLYFEGSALVGGSLTQISLSDGTNNNGVKLRFDTNPNRFTIFLRGNAGTFAVKTISGVTQTDNNKVALVWDITNFRIWLNGVEAGTIATNDLPVGLDTLNFANNTGSSNFQGKTKALAVWKEALTDAELTELTTI